jgi:hypothetical protein
MQSQYDTYKTLIAEIGELNEKIRDKRKAIKSIEDEFEDYLVKNGQTVIHFSDGSFKLKKIQYIELPKNSSKPLQKNE